MNNTSQKQQKFDREQRWRSDDDMNAFPKPSPLPFLLLILILGLFVVGAGVFIFLPTNEQQGEDKRIVLLKLLQIQRRQLALSRLQEGRCKRETLR